MLKSDKSGIYIITNLIDGKMYVGYANNFRKRKGAHFAELKGNYHKNNHLQNAYNLYGKNNFIFEILEEYPNKGYILPSMENYWVNILNTNNENYGYNLKPTNPYNQTIHTQETKDKISNSHKGKKLSPEHCKSIGLSKCGIIPSEETKEKLRNSVCKTYGDGIFKLNKEKVIEIIELSKQGISTKELTIKFNVGKHTINNIKRGKSWSFVTGINKK